MKKSKKLGYTSKKSKKRFSKASRMSAKNLNKKLREATKPEANVVSEHLAANTEAATEGTPKLTGSDAVMEKALGIMNVLEDLVVAIVATGSGWWEDDLEGPMQVACERLNIDAEALPRDNSVLTIDEAREVVRSYRF